MSGSTGSARRGAPVPAAPRRTPLQSLYRFVRTPKGTLLWILLGFVVLALLAKTPQHPLPDVVAAVVGAVLADIALSGMKGQSMGFPSGAIISGLIISFVLAWQTPVYVDLLLGIAAVTLRHIIRTRWSNVFNPAVLALILGTLMFHLGQSWWGAAPFRGSGTGIGFLNLVPLIAAAWYMAGKVGKLPLALAYLLTTMVGFTAAAFLGAAAHVDQVYRWPDVEALIFFSAFMLTDPPTSPARQGDQLWFGAVAGAVAVLTFLTLGVQWFIMAGLPVANVLESVRRVTARRRAPAPASSRRGAATAAARQGPAATHGRPAVAAATGRPGAGGARRSGAGGPGHGERRPGTSAGSGATPARGGSRAGDDPPAAPPALRRRAQDL